MLAELFSAGLSMNSLDDAIHGLLAFGIVRWFSFSFAAVDG